MQRNIQSVWRFFLCLPAGLFCAFQVDGFYVFMQDFFVLFRWTVFVIWLVAAVSLGRLDRCAIYCLKFGAPVPVFLEIELVAIPVLHEC